MRPKLGVGSRTVVLALIAPLACLSACGEGRAGDGEGASSNFQATASGAAVAHTAADSSFARLVERLSEPGGYFDTDNLISNEASYLHVISGLRAQGVRGGAYIGVGPDQNFSYIAHIRPEIAFILDIRRDNLLQHLLFKALFELSRNRMEYLCLLLGRPLPESVADWNDRSIEELLRYLDRAPASRDRIEATWHRIQRRLDGFGVPLTTQDTMTIRGIHGRFVRHGLDLKFSSHGRVPLPEYPTFRELLLERDLAGQAASYLVREEHFTRVKSLQERDLVIPVVGDFAGEHALEAIGREIEARGLELSAFYTSNVELYLMRGGGWGAYVDNLRALPHHDGSVLIRSYFARMAPHPQRVPGYVSVQLLQSLESLLARERGSGYRSYYDLVTRDVLPALGGAPVGRGG